MTESIKKRLVLPDVLKGLAVVLMIQVHVMEQFIDPRIAEGILGKISLFLGGVPAAPIFMVVMGYFTGFTRKGPGNMIIRGIILFAGGIFLNILLNISYIINFIKAGYPELITGSIFGVDILPLAGMSLIIIALLTRISGNAIYLFALSLTVAVATPFVNNLLDGLENFKYISAFIGGTSEWSYFPLFPWLAYPLLGLAVHSAGISRWNRIKPALNRIIGVLILTVFITGLKMGFNISSNLPLYYHHGILFFLWAISFMFILIFALNLMNPDRAPLNVAMLTFMGREVTMVYVIQWILIGNLAAWASKSFMIPGYIVLTLGFILASVLFAWLFRRVKPERLFKLL